ncbi:MAG: dipeptidase [Lactobacillales bacterium]|jgi:membrane dipeptidase|nr:dipeptidase [Lactobacillales bacterium]
MIRYFDAHSDTLSRILRLRASGEHADFKDSELLNNNLNNLIAGGVKCQSFAIFVPPYYDQEDQWNFALKQVNLFKTEILSHPEIVHITDLKRIDEIPDDKIGALLTLEGCTAIARDLWKLELLISEGVKILSLVWNEENSCADGIMSARGAGVSDFGKEVINLCNKNNVIMDVSHISVNGFYDVVKLADKVIASHSNAKVICHHPRNLDDNQIKALIEKGGIIHNVFTPPFVAEYEGERFYGTASIDDVIKHVKHIISLGGINNLAIGTDFDGIENYVTGLENSSKMQNYLTALQDEFGDQIAQNIAINNFMKLA